MGHLGAAFCSRKIFMSQAKFLLLYTLNQKNYFCSTCWACYLYKVLILFAFTIVIIFFSVSYSDFSCKTSRKIGYFFLLIQISPAQRIKFATIFLKFYYSKFCTSTQWNICRPKMDLSIFIFLFSFEWNMWYAPDSNWLELLESVEFINKKNWVKFRLWVTEILEKIACNADPTLPKKNPLIRYFNSKINLKKKIRII